MSADHLCMAAAIPWAAHAAVVSASSGLTCYSPGTAAKLQPGGTGIGIKGVRFTCAGQNAMSPFRALLLPCSQKQREKRLQYGG